MHESVLLHESVDALFSAHTPRDGIVVDGTFGRGGHSRAILARLSLQGRLIAFDRDPQAVAEARAIDDARFTIVHAPFSELRAQLRERGIAQIHGALFDLGVSSPQLDQAERGFSFMRDGPLDMRMDTTRGETAADYLARVDERALSEVIREYGEERFARAIAKAIVDARQSAPGARLSRTHELREIVAQAVRTRERGQHPATRTFQALRIAVNRELAELEAMLAQVGELMAPHARLAVISFHSLEDRIVKHFMQHAVNPLADEPRALRRLPIPAAQKTASQWEFFLKSATASDAEIARNPRARSARLRVLEKRA